MRVITGIKRNVKNAGRCSVFVNDEFFAACSIDVAITLGLRNGLEVTPELENQLREQDRLMSLKQRIWRFVAYKPRTERQTRSKLTSIGCLPDEQDLLIAWLQSLGELNDADYAQRFVHASVQRKPMSATHLRAALLAKGIPKDVVIETVDQVDPDELLRGARQLADKKMRSLAGVDNSVQREKIQRYLAGKGYTWQVIKQVLESVGLTTILLLCLLLPASAQEHENNSLVVHLQITILDAISDSALQIATVTANSVGASTATQSAPKQYHVVDGIFTMDLQQQEETELSIEVPGFFVHQQKITVRMLDSVTWLNLTARLYPINSTIASVQFIRGTDSLSPAWYPSLERIAREVSAQNFLIELRGWSGGIDSSDSLSLTAQRIHRLTEMLLQYGIGQDRILHTITPLTRFLPILLSATEDPQSQLVEIRTVSK